MTSHDSAALTEAVVESDIIAGGNALTVTNALTAGDAFLLLHDNGTDAGLFLVVALSAVSGAITSGEVDVIKLLTLTGEGAISASINAANIEFVS